MKIIIISCTQKSMEDFMSEPLGQSWKKHPDIDDGIIYDNNTKGLSECYNNAIDKINENAILLFCHDDLFLLDLFLKEKLEKAFETYDVVGVAGSSYFSLKNERVAWHISPKESWSGFVEHPYTNGVDGQTYMTYFGPTPKQVAIIDGLFIAVKFQTLIDNNISFQEEFTFDGYDTSFCLECLKKNLKIGVTNIHTYHLSHGEGIRDDKYIEVSNMLRKKYGK